MKKSWSLLFACLCSISLLGDELNVLRSPKEKHDNHPLGELKGILLAGSENDAVRRTVNETSFQVVNLDIPGGSSSLRNKLMPFVGHSFSLSTIKSIEKIIVQYYQKNKRPLVFVQLPKKPLGDGILRLVVLESTLGKVEATGAKWFSNESLANRVRLKPDQVINEKTLISDLAWMNRSSFRRTDLIYSPGKASYTTDVNLVSIDRFPLRLYSGSDNTGIKSIDSNRVFFGFNWVFNKWLLDHQLDYQYTASPDFHQFQSHTAHYTAPLSWRHLFVVFGAYSTVSAEKLPIKAFTNEGWAMQASGRYVIPLTPAKHLTHEMQLGFDFKRTNNTVLFSEFPVFSQIANIGQFLLSYGLGYETRRTKTSFHTDAYWSPGQMMQDQSSEAFSSLRKGANAKYVYLRAALGENLTIFGDWQFLIRFAGQLASRCLLPSEQLGIGGYNTVRGYLERIANGDEGFVASGEFRTPTFKVFLKKPSKYNSKNDGMQFLWFLDYGRARNHSPSSVGEPINEYLFSTGPGFRYQIDPYLNIRLDWGMKIHKVTDDHSFGRLHFSVVAGY